MLRLAVIMPKSLSQHIKDYIKANKLRQSAFATKAQLSESTISEIMSGGTTTPTPTTLKKIAEATGLSYIEIRAMLDPLLAEDLRSYSRMVSSNVSKTALSEKALLVAEEFDKLPAGTQDLFLGLVLNYHSGSGADQK